MRAALGDRDDARAVLLFASGLLELEAVAEGAAQAAGAVTVVGCSTAAAPNRSTGADDTVIAMALGGDGLSVSTVAAAAVENREAGVRAAACLGDVADHEHRLLLLFADGPAAEHADLVRGAYSVAGAGVPLAGGIAAHPLGSNRGALLHGASVLRGAVLGVAIGSDAPLGVGLGHGWEPVGAPMLVTRAERGRVLELDHRPALSVYLEQAGLGGDPAPDAVLAHPLARHGRNGPAHVRAVELHERGDEGFACALEAGSLVSVMRPRAGGALDGVDVAAQAALAPLAGDAPQALLAFRGCGRQAALAVDGLDGCDELARLAEHAAGAPVAAVATHGEVARTCGIAGFHQQSIVIVAVG